MLGGLSLALFYAPTGVIPPLAWDSFWILWASASLSNLVEHGSFAVGGRDAPAGQSISLPWVTPVSQSVSFFATWGGGSQQSVVSFLPHGAEGQNRQFLCHTEAGQDQPSPHNVLLCRESQQPVLHIHHRVRDSAAVL